MPDRSCLFVHLVGINAEGWLQRAPEEWPQNPDYTFMSEVARDMLVDNDCTKRNIKAITNYIHFTRDVNGMLGGIVLVGEDRALPHSKPTKGKSSACINKLKIQYSFTPSQTSWVPQTVPHYDRLRTAVFVYICVSQNIFN